jgi:hypothetical protein
MDPVRRLLGSISGWVGHGKTATGIGPGPTGFAFCFGRSAQLSQFKRVPISSASTDNRDRDFFLTPVPGVCGSGGYDFGISPAPLPAVRHCVSGKFVIPIFRSTFNTSNPHTLERIFHGHINVA